MSVKWPAALESLAPEQRARLLLATLQSGDFSEIWQAAWTKPQAPKVASPAAVPVSAPSHVQDVVQQASARTGVSQEALVAIIDAEAGRDAAGRWKVAAQNPRSSAQGLGQFLARTWVGEAERAGTWLHTHAQKNGWLTSAGKIRDSAKGALLALRQDARASIEAVADYARHNLHYLQSKGVALPQDATAQAKLAYLGHHLGAGDALRFVRGGLSSARASALLVAQIGAGQAQKRIAAAGDGALAHRQWLEDYMARHVAGARLRHLA